MLEEIPPQRLEDPKVHKVILCAALWLSVFVARPERAFINTMTHCPCLRVRRSRQVEVVWKDSTKRCFFVHCLEEVQQESGVARSIDCPFEGGGGFSELEGAFDGV